MLRKSGAEIFVWRKSGAEIFYAKVFFSTVARLVAQQSNFAVH